MTRRSPVAQPTTAACNSAATRTIAFTTTTTSTISSPSNFLTGLSSTSSSWRGLNCRHRHFYHTTSHLSSTTSTASPPVSKKDKERLQAEPTAQELAETPETIPEWQNPSHFVVDGDSKDQEQIFFDPNSESPSPSALPLPPFETHPDAIVAPPHIEDLAQQIVQLNLLELKELVDQIAQAFQFDDQVMAASYGASAMMGGGAAGGASAEPVEEAPAKVIFDVKLIGACRFRRRRLCQDDNRFHTAISFYVPHSPCNRFFS